MLYIDIADHYGFTNPTGVLMLFGKFTDAHPKPAAGECGCWLRAAGSVSLARLPQLRTMTVAVAVAVAMRETMAGTKVQVARARAHANWNALCTHHRGWC